MVRVRVKVRVRCLEGSGRSTAWKEQLGAKNTIEQGWRDGWPLTHSNGGEQRGLTEGAWRHGD